MKSSWGGSIKPLKKGLTVTPFCFLSFSGVYRPRALPSAGIFPFARSFLCDFKGSKTTDPQELSTGLPNLRASRYGIFLSPGFSLSAGSLLKNWLLGGLSCPLFGEIG